MKLIMENWKKFLSEVSIDKSKIGSQAQDFAKLQQRAAEIYKKVTGKSIPGAAEITQDEQGKMLINGIEVPAKYVEYIRKGTKNTKTPQVKLQGGLTAQRALSMTDQMLSKAKGLMATDLKSALKAFLQGQVFRVYGYGVSGQLDDTTKEKIKNQMVGILTKAKIEKTKHQGITKELLSGDLAKSVQLIDQLF